MSDGRPSTDDLLGAWEPEPDGRCQSLDGNDLRCELPENHDGDHRHLLTWENPPAAGPTRAGDEAFEAAYARMIGKRNRAAVGGEIALWNQRVTTGRIAEIVPEP